MKALPANGHHSLEKAALPAENGDEDAKQLEPEGSGEGESFTSARSVPLAAAQPSAHAQAEDSDAAASVAGGLQSDQPSLLPQSLAKSTLRQSFGVRDSLAAHSESPVQRGKAQAKHSGSLLDFFRSSSRGEEAGPGDGVHQHLNGRML